MQPIPVAAATTIRCSYCNGMGYLGKLGPEHPPAIRRKARIRIHSLIKCMVCNGEGRIPS